SPRVSSTTFCCMYSSSSGNSLDMVSLEPAADVVEGHVKHEPDDEEEPAVLHVAQDVVRQRPDLQLLDREQEEVTAVEHGDRQDVEHGEIDRKNGQEVEELSEAVVLGDVVGDR